jgi:hypothetical protein
LVTLLKKKKKNKRGKGNYFLRKKKTPEASLWSRKLIPSGDIR